MPRLLIKDLKEIPKLPKIPYLSQDTSFYDWSPTARPYKEYSRHIVAQTSGHHKKNLLALPGTTGRDIQLLKYYDVPESKAHWTLIEREAAYMQVLKKNTIKMKLFKTSETVDYQQMEFNAAFSSEPYDWAWFDLLGSLNYRDIQALRYDFNFTLDADIFFTLAYRHAARGRYAAHGFFSILKKILQDAILVKALGFESIIQTEITNLSKTNPQLSRSTKMDLNILINWLIFRYILNGYDFDAKAYIYMDLEHEVGSSEMLLFHFSNFKKSKNLSLEFKGVEIIERLLKIISCWQDNYSDEEIATQARLNPEIIARWRSVNDLPAKGEIAEYQMAEGFMALLKTLDVQPPSLAQASHILGKQLRIFNPRIVKTPEIKLSQITNGLKIITPRGSYFITVGSDLEFKFEETRFQIQLHPLFLHPFNSESLEAIYRFLFVGDEFLHPQLCNKLLDKNGKLRWPDCFELTPPQTRSIEAFQISLAMKENMGAIVLPTGTGKTVVGAEISQGWTECKPTQNNTCRILFLAHQREILDQTIKTFLQQTSFNLEDMGILYPTGVLEFRKHSSLEENLNAKVVFATIQGLTKPATTDEEQEKILSNLKPFMSLPRNHFSLIIVDEFHHYNALTWQPLLEHFGVKATYMLGLSATPFRNDALNPMNLFEDNYVYRMGMGRAIWSGYLTTPLYEIYPDRTDYETIIREIKAESGRKISKNRLKKLFSKDRIKFILETFIQRSKNKQTIVFCNNTIQAQQMAEAFNNPKKYGINHPSIKASFITHKSSAFDRQTTIKDYQNKEIQVICVAQLFDEGVDLPNTETLLILRSTKSPLRFIQQLGRGLRLYPGKRNVLILDFVGNYDRADKILNLSEMLGINRPNLPKLSKATDPSDPVEWPILPSFHCKYGEAVKVIVKNVTDDISKLVEEENRKKAEDLRDRFNASNDEIAKKLGTTYSKIRYWLRDRLQRAETLDEQKEQLIGGISQLLNSGFTDEMIQDFLLNDPDKAAHLTPYQIKLLSKQYRKLRSQIKDIK